MNSLRLIVRDKLLWALVSALALGFLWPQSVSWLAPGADAMLASIFFLSALSLDPTKLKLTVHTWRQIGLFTVGTLILLPMVTFVLVSAMAPTLLIPLVLLAAMPAGLTSPVITGSSGGDQGLATLLTIASSLLAPFLVPIVIQLLLGTAISIDAVAMGTKIALLALLPLILGIFAQRFLFRLPPNRRVVFQPISLALLVLIIAGIVGNQIDGLASGAPLQALLSQLPVLLVYFGLLHTVAWIATKQASTQTSQAIIVSFVYMNFTLALTLAHDFFPDPVVISTLALATIPWTIGVGVWRATHQRHHLL